ncbi:hypothetical protein BUALT_Bualt11G0102800 [Buddleja alternifolia]|uniref:Protein FAR1-RELATED SEQUENCE n=1 Tax=Buddleja alternifolia TaxID=168488 RepID=A0AAV6X4U2_9LAMI|nr:hypothetical protein BUALT_Bualt11G0102800 [Buddleja alternifolia]
MACFHELQSNYGPVLRLKLGTVNTVVLQSAAAAAELFKKHDLQFSDRQVLDSLTACDYINGSLAHARYGEYWRTVRRLCSSELTVHKRINDSASLRQKSIDEMINWIKEMHQIRDVMDLKSEKGNRFFAATNQYMEWIGAPNLVDVFPFLRWIDPQGIRRNTGSLWGIVGFGCRFCEGQIEERKLGKKTRDFLDAFLEFELQIHPTSSLDLETHHYLDMLRTFLKSMGGKQPETIFTDQCQAMMNAIDTCMHHCDSEEEFEVTWKKMIDDYNLDGHNWLKGMYNLSRRWSTTFSNNKFSAGLLATSRSEGTNSILKKAGNRTISLYSFVLNYEKVQKTWRANERIEDTRCRHGKPATILKNNPLLDHGANVYTLNIFNLFQVELFESLNIQLREQPSHSGHFPRVFEMQSYGQNLKVRIVVFDVQKEEIRCSCHKFESMGILCRHALIVFNCMNVHIIPKMYIKKRWTKGMRNRLSNERSACVSSGSENASGCGNESEMIFVNQKMRFIYDLIMQCKAHEETRNMLTESFNSVAEKTITWLESEHKGSYCLQ